MLDDPKSIPTKNSTLNGVAINNSTNEQLNITLQYNFNATDYNDNPFSSFITAMEAAYYWTSNNWVQRDKFDFWAIDLITFIASIFLVTILQNMLIAFMR